MTADRGKSTDRYGTPATETTQQLVSAVEQFTGDVDINAVDALKQAVTLANNSLESLIDEVLHDVWLASAWNRQPRDH